MHPKPAGSAAVSTAIAGLRMYWGTALVAAATGSVAMAVILPVMQLARSWSPGHVPRVLLEQVPDWSLSPYVGLPARGPEETQQHALALLFGILLGAALATLALALVTVLSMSAARASQRVVEVAVRRAVGASRRQLLHAALTEGLLVSAVMIGVGGVLGAGATYVAIAGWPGRVGSVSMSPTIAAIAALVSGTILGALFTLVAAGRRRVTESTAKPMHLHVAALQLGLSLVALTGGAMLVEHAGTHATVAHADGSGQVWRVTSPEQDPATRAAQYASLLARLGDPSRSVTTASMASVGAHTGLATVGLVQTDCGMCSENNMFIRYRTKAARFALVSPDTFATVGAMLVAGRGITSADTWDAPRVAVVSRGLATQHFQDGQAVGRQIMIHTDHDRWYTVVGVVEEPAITGFGGALQATYGVYLSVLQHPAPSVELLVRGAGTADEVRAVLQQALGAKTALFETPESAMLAAQLAPLLWFGRWLGITGWALLLIAAAGTFVLLRFWVRTLRAELGVRRATGARRRDVYAFILPRALGTGLAGVAIALWLGPSVWQVMLSTTTTGGTPDWDLALFAKYGLLLIATALLGALLPARDAAHAAPGSLLATAGE